MSCMPAIQRTPAGGRLRQNMPLICPSLMPHEGAALESLMRMCSMSADVLQALRAIHQPRDWADVEAAKRRLAFEELLLLQLKLLLRREIDRTPRSEADLEGTRVTQLGMMEAGRDVLGFTLTAAQDRVLTEVCKACARSMLAKR